MRLGAVLYVYKGEWGLPSIDFECLRVLCLAKFTRCPLKIDTKGNPFTSGAGKLPYLQIGNEKFIGYRKIKNLLDTEGYPIDGNLPSDHDKHLSTAYASWVFTKLHAYYHYYMYGEPTNYEITRTLYGKRTRFPFNFYYPSTYQHEAHEVLLTMSGFDIYDKVQFHESAWLIQTARDCVDTLSKKLGKKVWFFGDVFSEFDAIVYSYLALILKVELPTNPLQNHIKSCQNLVNFINRISKDIFKEEAFSTISGTSRKRTAHDPMMTPTERNLVESEVKIKVFAAIGAIVAMSAFAAWRGLYGPISHRNFDGLDYDDDDDGEE